MKKQQRPITNPHPSEGKPRGIRFPDEEYDKYMAMAKASRRTFNDMILYLCARGSERVEQDAKDLAEGRRRRLERK